MRKLLSLEILLPIFLVSLALAQNDQSIGSTSKCDYSPIEVVFLIDITAANRTNFKIQQQRVLRTLKHLESVLSTRRQRYGVIGFHSSPVTLMELGSPFSNDTNRIATLIGKLRSKQHVQTSVARAFEAAVAQFKTYGEPASRRLIILAHDGVNTDYVAETIKAGASIQELGIHVFALSGNPLSNFLALLGYTGDRERLLIDADDTQEFHHRLDEAVGACVERGKISPKRAKGVRIGRAQDKPKLFEEGQNCEQDKVDLILVLDTSGSVYEIFEDQKILALEILDSFPEDSYKSRLQASVVRFAATSEVLISFMIGRSKEKMLDELRKVEFTGQSTRIASAIDMAIDEMARARRRDAKQVFVLISDGHGQEYWNVVQMTGRALQDTGAELFAASAGRDYNNAELLIYVGHKSRLFIGTRYTRFVPTLTSYIGKCVGVPTGKRVESGSRTKSAEKDNIERTLKIDNDEGGKKKDGLKGLVQPLFTTAATISKRLKVSKETTTTASTTTTTTEIPTTSIAKATTRTLEETTTSAITTEGTTSATEATTTIPDEPTTAELQKELPSSTTLPEKTTAETIEKREDGSGNTSQNGVNSADGLEGSGQEMEGSGEEASAPSSGNDSLTAEMLTSVQSAKMSLTSANVSATHSTTNEEEVSASSKTLEGFKLRDPSTSSTLLCDIDLIMILDRSTSVEGDFDKEITVATKVVDLFSDGDYSTSKVRIGAVSFARDARLELPLMGHEKLKILEIIKKIEHTGGSTSAVEGAKLAIARLLSNKRADAKLIIILLTDGHSQDYWNHLIETSTKLRSSPNSVLLAYTASNFFSRTELQAWTANKKHVFMDNEEEQFLTKLKENVQNCSEAMKEVNEGLDVKQSNLIESTATSSTLDDNKETSTTKDAAAISVSEQEDSASSTGAPVGDLEVKTSEGLEITLTTTAASQELSKRADVDQENLVEIETEISKLNQVPDVVAETNETATVTTPEAREVTETTTIATETAETTTEQENTETKEHVPEDETRLVEAVKTIITTTRSPSEEPKVHGIKTADEISEKVTVQLSGKASLPGSCIVDLLFVIDVSTSVEAEFQRQLQFAVDLVKRLPEEDFENRVKVGAVLFNSNATLHLKLGQISSRTSILDFLLSVENTGGSTSLVNGFQMAIHELEERKRPNARQMVVLVSDGNSQDLWDDVIHTSNRLRTTGADVYAVTVSKQYMFKELELYAGDKWRVYIDARIKQFLNEAEQSLLHCGRAPIEGKEELSAIKKEPQCDTDPVEIIIAIDTTSVEQKFFEERQFAEDLIKFLPSSYFEKRFSVAVFPFDKMTEASIQLGSHFSREDVLYELQRLQNSHNGPANFTTVVSAIKEELKSRRRPNTRVVIVLISGNDAKFGLSKVKEEFESLHQLETEVFAVAATEGNEDQEELKNIFSSSKLDRFLEDVGSAISKCLDREETKAPVREQKTIAKALSPDLIKFRDPENRIQTEVIGDNLSSSCKYRKVDLQIILDASSSRESVFEQQRELALTIIEKLPISADGTHVAVGINSFTSVPTLRQTLGLGRDKKMVRNAIFNIAYNGGSTLTAQAVELSVDDLLRGRRKDAIQVVILMNDGISQDSWQRVKEASQRLNETGAERFGVALGGQVDFRELELYIGNRSRIYRDGETDKLIHDFLALLQEDCSNLDPEEQISLPTMRLREEIAPVDCGHPNLDLLVLFDNTDKSGNMSDPVVNANRYLLLDVLGSLANTSHVRVSVISFSKKPKIELDFTNISERDRIFAKVEAIKAVGGMPSYADAITVGLDMLEERRRGDAKATMIIVGDGMTKDPLGHTVDVSKRIRETNRLSCLAVDSSPRTDIRTLKTFTGRRDHVFDYERNSLFAEEVKRMAKKPNLEKCPQLAFLDAGKRALAARVVRIEKEETYSTLPSEPIKLFQPLEQSDSLTEVKRDLSSLDLEARKNIEDKANSSQDINGSCLAPPRITSGSRNLRVRINTPLFSMRPTTRRTTTTQITTTAATASTTPSSFANIFQTRSTEAPPERPTTFKPGCLLDVIVVLDSSGSVEETFRREKELAAGIIDLFRIGPDNARVSIIKFAAEQKVKTVWSFNDLQSRLRIRKALENVLFSSGTTAIHSAILRAIKEYSEKRGARPGRALPIAIIFTDGYGQQSTEHEATILRELIPHTYAVAINHQYPISRQELLRITGDQKRVYTDANIADLHSELKSLTRDCIID